jgi:hypothetical protein
MINYGIVTTRYNLWFEVAKEFKSTSYAEPVFWLDTRYSDKEFRNEFPNCSSVEVLEYNNWCKGLFDDKIDKNFDTIDFPSERWSTIKDIVKMMFNRQNALGQWRNLDMDAAIMNIYTNLYRMWPKGPIDIFLFTETPHTPVDYIIYEICKLKKIPTLMLHQHNITAVCLFKWDIGGKSIRLKNSYLSNELESKIKERLNNHFEDLRSKPHFETWYMKNFNEQSSKKLTLQLKKFKFSIMEIQGNLRKKRQSRSVYRSFNGIPPRLLDPIRAQLVKTKMRNKLIENFYKNCDTDFPENFVLFPLHYEPERTTVPDGGLYYDQMKALMALRNSLDSSIPILVKEHSLTFSTVLTGEMGRSSYFYDFVKSLPNTYLIDYKLNTRKLLKEARLVATVCGSVLYEAVALGTPAIMFGHSWFEGAPGIYHFNDLKEIKLDELTANYEEMMEYFNSQISNYSVLVASHTTWIPPLKVLIGSEYSIEMEKNSLIKALPELFETIHAK